MRLRKLKYLIGEGIKSIWANRLMSLASVGVLVACMLLIGIAVAISFNVNKAMGEIQKQNVVMAYFKDRSWAVNEGLIVPDEAEDGTPSDSAEGEEAESEDAYKDLYFIHNDSEGEELCEEIKKLENVADAVYISGDEGLEKMLATMPKAQQEYFNEWLSEDNPLYGLYRFKKGFGGDFTEFVGEMDLVLNKPIYLFVEKGTSLFKDLRKTVYLIKNRDKK